MHQQAALRERPGLASTLRTAAPDRGALEQPHLAAGLRPLVDEPGRVLHDEQRRRPAGRAPRSGRREVPGQDGVLAEPRAREEAVRGLGPGPVLAGERQRLAHRRAELPEQGPQPLDEPPVAEVAPGDLAVGPRRRTAAVRLGPAVSHALHPECLLRGARQGIMRDSAAASSFGPAELWVIARLRRRLPFAAARPFVRRQQAPALEQAERLHRWSPLPPSPHRG